MSDFTNYYNELSANPNNISYWYPKIKDCGMLVPETLIVTVPEDIVIAFFMEGDVQANQDKVYEWVKTAIMPALPPSLRGLIFMKNGAFSNKFDFNTCAIRANALEIARNLIEINYTSLMFDTGGNTEVAIRERILSDSNIPCIYHGMPLNNEYRVFYDFDSKKALYSVNYWDWDYCHDAIARDVTDKAIYEAYYPTLMKHYADHCGFVEKYVEDHMYHVEGLTGIWSVDVMEVDHSFWLIDMAVGYRSAYWDPEKVKEALEDGKV